MDNTYLMKVMELTDEEQIKLYLERCSKEDLAKMLTEVNKHVKNLSRVELPVSDDFAENTFNQIEQYMGEKYRNWKLLKNKHYETIGYKRAYLDIKKIHKKICKQNSR